MPYQCIIVPVYNKEDHMTTEKAQKLEEPADSFAYLSPYEFVLLTTFRKNGVGVPTAMWFAHEHGKLYMVTGRTSGKIKGCVAKTHRGTRGASGSLACWA